MEFFALRFWTQQSFPECCDALLAGASDVASSFLVQVTYTASAVAKEDNMCSFQRIAEGIQGLQKKQDLNVVAAAADVPFFAFDHKERAETDESSMLDGALRVAVNEACKQLQLQHIGQYQKHETWPLSRPQLMLETRNSFVSTLEVP